MATVLLALAPGLLADAAFHGVGILVQIVFALTFALSFEALMLKLRAQPIGRFLGDGSAALTAVLFALCVPATSPWWIAAIGMGMAIVFAKHPYGGLGHNLFNPAMAGVAMAWLCFPAGFSHRMPASGGGIPVLGDGVWLWITFLYSLGGVFLLWKKITRWQAPIATLGGAILATLLLSVSSPNGYSLPQAVFPATWVLGAFFIVTDPVTGCASSRGRLIFGAGVGFLAPLIGRYNNEAVGFAFAVLLMNCAAPWIDRRTQPTRNRSPNA